MTPNASPVIEFRDFTQTDWLGLAGAVPFPDGSEPRIGDLEVDGIPALAIVDAEGLSIIFCPESDADPSEDFYRDRETRIPLEDPEGDESPEAGAVAIRRALALLSPSVSSLALRALGFRSDAGGPFALPTEV